MTLSHKEWIIDVFDRASPEFGEKASNYFNYFAERLVEFGHLTKNEKVLDAATGKGAILSAAARILEPPARIVGIDISTKMLQEAKKRVPSWVELMQMDAEHLTFSDHSFDVVFCAFAIYFFPNVQAVLAEFKRVLKPRGRLVVSSFGPRHPLFDWTYQRCRELGASREMLINRFETADSLKEQFEMAHFCNIKTSTESCSYSFENAKGWWDSIWTHGMRAMLEQLSPQNLETLRQGSFAHARQLYQSNKINVDSQAVFISAQTDFK